LIGGTDGGERGARPAGGPRPFGSVVMGEGWLSCAHTETLCRGPRPAVRLGSGVSGPPCPKARQRSGNRRVSGCSHSIVAGPRLRTTPRLILVYGVPRSLQQDF